MSGMRAHLANRLRSSSLSAVPPRPDSDDYSADLARAAASILYQSPIPSKENRPVYILNAAALPDSREADFDQLLPYVLARLPEEDDLLRGNEYEVIFFAGDSDGSATSRKNRPGWGWFLQAYHVLSRAMRKRLQKLYIVHEKAWVRILTEIFSTIASPKFRRKIIHASTLSNLALHIPIEDLLIPPSTYLHDRRISEDIFAPYASGKRAFGAQQPFPVSTKGKTRFPRVLRETTYFIIQEENIVSEGLFRVPPHAKLKEVLKEAYNRGQKFIVWKDNGVALELPRYPQAQHEDEILAEIDPTHAYSVFMAAGLVKSWYAELRQPLFPQTSYRDLKRLFGDPEDQLGLDRLKDLLSPSSEWSFLPAISREIMVRHLFPLLSAVAARQEQNKMTAENLAVCFAPALLRGPDQLEDAKMSSIIRRVITQAVESWSHGLREACGVDARAFSEDLRLPEDVQDWDDPLEGDARRVRENVDDENQVTGIIPQDKASLQHPPPLPPRSTNTQPRSASGTSTSDAVTRRKPAPALQVPPRYSTIMSDSPLDFADSPADYAAVANGFGPPRSTQGEFSDEKKTGTNSVGDSLSASQIIYPKRKALTAEQIDNAETAVAEIQVRKTSENVRRALPGLEVVHTGELPRRKAVGSANNSPVERRSLDTEVPVQLDMPKTRRDAPEAEKQPSVIEFRRPSWAASIKNVPSITSLARPVYPPNPTRPTRPASKSNSLPIPGPKPRLRAPSASLMRRMPSFETSNAPATRATAVKTGRLNLRKASVDDLRRLYEERAGTAKELIEAGKRR